MKNGGWRMLSFETEMVLLADDVWTASCLVMAHLALEKEVRMLVHCQCCWRMVYHCGR